MSARSPRRSKRRSGEVVEREMIRWSQVGGFVKEGFNEGRISGRVNVSGGE